MKKTICLLLAITFSISVLSACGSDKPPEPSETPKPTETAAPETATPEPPDSWDSAATPEDAFEFAGGVITKYIGEYDVVRVPRKIGGEDVIAIGESAFEKNKAITELYLHPNVKRIENKAFEWAENLNTVDLGQVETIGDNAFLMTRLVSLTMSPVVKTIGSKAFSLYSFAGKEDPVVEVVIPASVTYMAESAFQSDRFKKITFLGKILPEFGDKCFSVIPGSATIVVDDSFGEDVAADILLKFATAGLRAATPIIHMDGTPLFIDYSADYKINYHFGHIEKYIGDNPYVIIPAVIEGFPVTQISSGAFSGNEIIKTVVIPDGVEFIDSTAFADCPNLESVIIPDSVTEVGNSAFRESKNLKSITWSANADVPDYAFSESGIVSVVIPDGVKRIGEYAFRNCENLKEVYIGNTVTEMGESAFEYCNSLVVIDFLPASLTVIPKSAFYSCNSVQEIRIPEGVTRISDLAFSRCGDREVDMAALGANHYWVTNEPEKLGDNWIKDDSLPRLVKLYLPSTIKYIGWGIFAQARVDAIYLPAGMLEVSQLPEFDRSFDGIRFISAILVNEQIPDEISEKMNDYFEGIGAGRILFHDGGEVLVYVRELPE